MEKNNKSKSFFPLDLLKPLVSYLKGEEKKLKEAKKGLNKEDPFVTGERDADNSVDADVSENVEHDRASTLRKHVRKSLVEIRKTMTRIKIGKYGLCESCGNMIDTDRLSVKPTALRCIVCEDLKESKSGKK
jgi:RNA polymerase-binding transcription factor DksA